jgi:hypothetical protein
MRLGYSGEGSPDAGSTSYGWMQALFNGTGISQDGTLATTVNKMKVAQIPCNSEDSPDAGAFEVLVPQAFNSHYTKTVLGMSALESEASQDSSYHTARAEFMGIWTNSNSNLTVGYVQIWPYDASNWAAHTHVALYLE